MVALIVLSMALFSAACLHALALARRTRWVAAWGAVAALMALLTAGQAIVLSRALHGGDVDAAIQVLLLVGSVCAPLAVTLLGRSAQVANNLSDAVQAAKDAAELANQAKTNFLANMSHELRTPLNAIIGFAQVMRNEYLGPLGTARYREYASGIEESGQHLLDLIEDILDVSRIEAGQLSLRDETQDPVAIMDSVVRLVRPRADSQKVMLFHEPSQDLPLIRGDARRLRQALLNLLSNAVKFTPASGLVEIWGEVEADGGFAFIVRDTGIGMSADTVDGVMALFAQGEDAYSRTYQGAGLGLPIANGLMRLHGGYVLLDSEPGKGTIARACLPPARVSATTGGVVAERAER